MGQAIRLDPDSHRVVAGADDVNPANPLDAGEGVLDVDQGIIAEELLVEARIVRRQGDQHKDVRERFFGGDREAFDFLGKLGGGGGNPVLGEDRVHVRVGADLERDIDGHGAVVGIGRLHVDHVVDAVDLLFQGRGDRLFNTDSVGPGVVGTHLDDRRRDVGILLGRQSPEEHHANNHHENRDDHGNDGSSDEEISHGAYSLSCP